MARPVVALVGRPNVGKSTLFNRLIGERYAIVHDVPGTTRDRLYGTAEWRTCEFTVVDTGGITVDVGTGFTDEVLAQAGEAMAEADLIVFVVDGQTGLIPADEEVAVLLRRSRKPVVLAANKTESQQAFMNVHELHALGMGEPVAISSLHGRGTGDLLDAIVDRLPSAPEEPDVEVAASLAIIGRPNVGKSSLLNAILGHQRSIVSDIPGTTRDAIDTLVERDGEPYLLIDTAGIRRRGKIERGVEHFSVLRAVRAVERADVGVLVLDASEGVTAQDTHLAGLVDEMAKGLILVLNKWDLVPKVPRVAEEWTQELRREFNFVPYAPILFSSAANGRGVDRVLQTVRAIQDQRLKRVPTPLLNQAVREAVAEHRLSERGKQLKVFYATQPQVEPPTFVFFVNDPELVHFSYKRYLENRLRAAYGFDGTAIRMIFRGRREAE